MAPKLLAKPLAATIREHLKVDPEKLHRAAPPTAQQIASVHQLPTPAKEPDKPMARKKVSNRYTTDYKAKVVARVLKAKESGSETVSAIAVDEGLNETAIYNWLKAAKKANGAANGSAEPATPKPRATRRAEPEEPKNKLAITGLTPLIRELVIAELPAILAEELKKAFAGRAK